MCILSFICEEENGYGDTGHFTAWGTLYFPIYFISSFKGMLVIMINACAALYPIQPWIRLTLYNPNIM